MANTTVAPEFEPFPHRRRWTRDKCHRLAEMGFLDGRYELIDGEILSLMGQNPPHRMTLMLIAGWLVSLFGFYYLQMQGPIAIIGEEGETNEPEPDIAVTSEPTTAYRTRHPEPQELLLLVEVSDFHARVRSEYQGASLCPQWHCGILGYGRQRASAASASRAFSDRIRGSGDLTAEQTVSLAVRPKRWCTSANCCRRSKTEWSEGRTRSVRDFIDAQHERKLMPKITLIGAGSTVFAKNLLGDILSFPELADSHIALMDINDERLATSSVVAHKVAQRSERSRRSRPTPIA